MEKPLGVSIEQDLACRKVFRENKRDLPVRHAAAQPRRTAGSAASWSAAGGSARSHTIEVIAPNGGRGRLDRRGARPAGFDYDMWLRPGARRPYTADRCHPPGTYWIYDYSIGYLGGWGAHPLDIMVWGSDADLAGPMTVEGTGVIPAKGLYDTVYNWNMKIQMADGVKMTFKPGGDSTKFIGTEGWVRISARRASTPSPKSLLESKIGANDVHLVDSPNHWPELHRRGEVAAAAGEHVGRRRAVRHASATCATSPSG